ncbi:MAG: UDP-2,3-diacylglucosamine diphosphatase [Verrucomicrobia bacterium]|nr:MAG: UDP-2,3-diacylglucosamine diphosphatase [Verrucomicrobiota bacterium]
MKKKIIRYKTIILSDVHLGSANSKAREVNHFLRHTRSEKLILNGDIIDGWQLRRGARWTKHHTKFVRHVLKKLQKENTHVVYLRGNHDDILSRFLPLQFGRLEVVEDHIHSTANGDYLVLHGDVFDSVIKNMVIVAHLGDLGYKILLSLNRVYNKFRAWRGKEYYSLSRIIKAKVKSAVSHISRFEQQLASLARARGCRGVICGHIHTPEIRMIGDIHYLNSGDWVESLTAIVEHQDGRFELIDFKQFCEMVPFDKASQEAQENEDIDPNAPDSVESQIIHFPLAR